MRQDIGLDWRLSFKPLAMLGIHPTGPVGGTFRETIGSRLMTAGGRTRYAISSKERSGTFRERLGSRRSGFMIFRTPISRVFTDQNEKPKFTLNYPFLFVQFDPEQLDMAKSLVADGSSPEEALAEVVSRFGNAYYRVRVGPILAGWGYGHDKKNGPFVNGEIAPPIPLSFGLVGPALSVRHYWYHPNFKPLVEERALNALKIALKQEHMNAKYVEPVRARWNAAKGTWRLNSGPAPVPQW